MSRSFSLSVILVVTSLVIVRFPARLTAQSDVPLAVQIELLHEGLELINRHNASLGAAIGCDSAAFINLLNDLDASGSTPLFSKTSVLENDFAVTLSSGMGEVQDVTAFYSTYRDHFELAPGYDEPYRFGLMRVRPFAEQEHSGGQIYEGRIYFRTSYHHGTSRDIDEQTLAFDLVGKPGGLRLAQVSVKGDLADLSGNELLTSEVFQNYLGKRDLLVSKRSDEAALKSWLKQKSDQSVAYFISTINASIAKSKALYEIDLEQAQTLLSKAEQLSNTLIRTSQPAAYREMREQIDALNYAINAEERRRRDALLSERDRLLDDANRYLGQGELSAALEKAQAANALQATSESSALENQLKQEYGDLSGLTSLLKKEAQGKTTALRDSIESHEANLTLKHHLIGFWEFHRASELPMGEVQTRHFMQALEHCNECIAQDAGYLPCYGVRVGVMKQLISFRYSNPSIGDSWHIQALGWASCMR